MTADGFLKITADLLASLERKGIRYCQWKTNDRLAEALRGDTDLDLLVDRRQSQAVEETLAAGGFKRGRPGFWLQHAAIESYVGLDPVAAKLAHIHLHYQLVTGKNRVKEYALPWERKVLESRRYDTENGAYVADFNMEMLLLVVRAAVKVRWRDRVFQFFGKNRLHGKWKAQFDWLASRVQKEGCRQLSQDLLGPTASSLFVGILDAGELSLASLQPFKKALLTRIRLNRMYGVLLTPMILWVRDFCSLLAFLNRNYLGQKFPLVRKGLASGGVFIVFIGPDGAGKSTLTREMAKLFSWKIDVFRAYLGAGDGPVAFYRWGLVKTKQRAEKLGVLKSKAKSESAPSPQHPKRPSAIVSGAKIVWALTLALEKRSKLKAAWQARNRGQIVICDRYPQTQLMGFNDGPLLSHWIGHRNRWLAKIAAWEMAPYHWADRNPPDLVIRLNVDLETAKQRDPEMSRAFLQRRIEAVRSFRFGAHTPVIEIDANQPVETVILQTQNAIWPHI